MKHASSLVINAQKKVVASDTFGGILICGLIVHGIVAVSVGMQAYIGVLHQYTMQFVGAAPLVCAVVLIFGIKENPKSPLRGAISVIRRRGISALALLVGFCFALSGFTTIKLAIPGFIPFYADDVLLGLERWAHMGHLPGELAAVWVPESLTYFLAILYGPVWMSLWLGGMAAIAFSPDGALKRRYIFCFFLTLVLVGSILAAAFSSYGPIFFPLFGDTTSYALTQARLDSSEAGQAMLSIASYLWRHYQLGEHGLGTGISAMPSMHVAVVTLNACCAWRVNKWLGAVAWAFAVSILLGSVYFGWHYALDGYVSIMIVAGLWWCSARVFATKNAEPNEGVASHMTNESASLSP